MTEAEWMGCTDPESMLEHLEEFEHVRDTAFSHRKLPLFSVACLRRVWPLLTDGRSRKVVETAEAVWADDGSDEEADQSLAAFHAAHEAGDLLDETGGHLGGAVGYLAYVGARAAINVSAAAAEAVGYVAANTGEDQSLNAWDEAWGKAERSERAIQALLLRDILGPLPFRGVSVDPSWLGWNGGSVVTLARSAYADPDPALLAVLADALEDAGCTDRAILEHLRGPGPHVRGCWALDLLLAKE